MSRPDYTRRVQGQRAYFGAGNTRHASWRIAFWTPRRAVPPRTPRLCTTTAMQSPLSLARQARQLGR